MPRCDFLVAGEFLYGLFSVYGRSDWRRKAFPLRSPVEKSAAYHSILVFARISATALGVSQKTKRQPLRRPTASLPISQPDQSSLRGQIHYPDCTRVAGEGRTTNMRSQRKDCISKQSWQDSTLWVGIDHTITKQQCSF